ncbi:MAG TPA: DUF2267 domain-containing protein [Streptosporangiaceae bacterium]|nr:DUF2267 domain-containing protein [Streptosporangiaceae bacterium]
MDYEQVNAVIRRAAGGLSSEEAELAAHATLQTLAERLSRSEALHILRELPAELKPWIYTVTDAAAFDIDEFLNKVADREDTDVETALRHARAVFFALGDALSPAEITHLAANLPQTFDPLVAEAQRRYLDIMPADQFFGRVALRLGADSETARRITDAGLETLAVRIASGQVEDLIANLDPVLHAPLRRGISAVPTAERLPLEEFLRQEAEKEGADPGEPGLFEETARHARAVFATLAEAVSDKEWVDATAELPDEYRAIVPARAR